MSLDLHKKYVSNLKPFDPKSYEGGFAKINQEINNILIEGATEISFKSLYPNLLVKFYKEGIFKKFGIEDNIDKSIIDKVESFLLNYTSITDVSIKLETKEWVNRLYITELSKIRFVIFDLYHQYMSQYYSDICELNKYSWLHIDTDTMIFAGESSKDFNIPHIGLPLSVVCNIHNFIYFNGEKRYITYSTKSQFKSRGYDNPKHYSEIILDMKQKIRSSKIDSII